MPGRDLIQMAVTVAEAKNVSPARLDPFLFIPLIISAVFIAAGNEDFGFDSAGWLDSFMYFAYFWHYPSHLPGLDQDYKASRLPWNLVGYAAHALGGPAAASYVLVLATLSAGGVAVYALIRDMTGDRAAAIVTATAWTCCTWVHGIGGWNYHMLAATDYFLFATWLAFRAATTTGRAPAVLSGICLAAAGHTHLQYATFLPLWALTYWSGLGAGSLHKNFRRAARDGVLAAAGAVGISIALAIFNVATGGDWLFFVPQLARAQYLMRQDVWWAEARVWMPTATYLIVPIVFMIGSLAVLRRPDQAGGQRPARVLVLQAWLAFAIMCFTQFARRKGTLDQSFLAFPVYAYGFPCIGVLLASGREVKRSAGLIVTCVVAILTPLLLLMPTTLPRVMTQVAALFNATTIPVVAPLAIALIGCGATLATRGAARLLVFAVWFGVVNAWIAPSPSAYGIHTPGYRRQMLELFHEADGMTAAFDPRLDGIKYYWDTDARVNTSSGQVPLALVFDSYVSTRGWQGNRLTHDRTVPVPQLTLNDLDNVVCVGLLGPPQNSRQLETNVQTRFAVLGRPLRHLTTRHLQRPNLEFDLTLLIPADSPDRHGPPCTRR